MNQEFDWDDANTSHIARHDVQRREAEQVFENDPIIVAIQGHEAEDRYVCLGHTNAARFLTVVYTEREGRIRVVTAYRMRREHLKRYLKGKSYE